MNTDNEKLNKRASRVLEKWGLENEMNQVQLKLAVESYARIQVKNRAMKWIALGGLFFVATFIGLMLGSVVIGLNISKDFKIRDGSLVQKGRNGEIIQTSQKYYSVNLKLSTPLDVIRGIKTVKIDLKDGKGSLSFSVVSFYYIKGKRLELYGVSHMAKVMGNGTIEIYPITHLNGEKRIDETNRVESDVGSATTTTKTSQVTNTEYIYDCQGLENMKTNGKYSLQNDIECKLERPLFFSEGESFEGTLEGNGNTITIKMKTNGVAGLFGVLNGATISNVLFRGDVSGVGYCAAVSVQTLPGTSFLSIGVYTNISCANNGNDSVTASSFSAVLLNPNNDNRTVVWKYSVSQATFNLILSREVQSFQAGFYGRVLPGQQVNTNFTFSYSASLFDVRQIDNGRISFYGFKNHQEKKYVYVPEDCYNYDKTNINFVNMCVNWFKEYRFENQECCSYFDSCPYLYCSFTSRVCMMCRNRYKSNLKQEYFEIVPVVNEN